MQFVDQDVPGPRRELRRLRTPRAEGRLAGTRPRSPSTSSSTTRRARSTRSPPATAATRASPRSRTRWTPEYRDLCAESVYEYGSRAGIWRLMRLFDEYQVKVTFFACAVAMERNPEVGQWLQESGHEPCSHGWRWRSTGCSTASRSASTCEWAIETIEKHVRGAPLGWFCRYGPSVNTRELRGRGRWLRLRRRRLRRRSSVLHRGRRERATCRPLHA